MYFVCVLDNWMDNNSSVGRGGRDSDNWGNRGGGRDIDKWGGRGGNRDSDGWGGRGSRLSPWRGNGNRRRNDDWENPNQKRWRREENSEYDEQQKIWKRGAVNDEEEWQNNKQGSLWSAGKKDEGNYSKFKPRENNEDRPRKPSKWGDRDSDDIVKEDRWNRKSISKDESTIDEGPHQTSAPMDLDNYEGDSVDNIEQLHGDKEQENSCQNQDTRQHDEFEKEEEQKIEPHYESGSFSDVVLIHDQESVQQNVDKKNNVEQIEHQDYQDGFSNNLEQLPPHNNMEEMQQNSESQLQNVQDNDYQKNTLDIDSKHDYDQMSQNYREQNQQFETECNNTTYNIKCQNYNQPYDEESSQNLNRQEQSVDNFVSQTSNETDERKYIEEKSLNNLYFNTDNKLPLNEPFEMEQQNNDNLPSEEIGIASADGNEVSEINTVESNQN
jgi:hypothetical protein